MKVPPRGPAVEPRPLSPRTMHQRCNHEKIKLITVDARPDLVERFRVERLPTLFIVEDRLPKAKLERPRGTPARCAPRSLAGLTTRLSREPSPRWRRTMQMDFDTICRSAKRGELWRRPSATAGTSPAGRPKRRRTAAAPIPTERTNGRRCLDRKRRGADDRRLAD